VVFLGTFSFHISQRIIAGLSNC